MKPQTREPRRTPTPARDEAKAWLLRLLANGPVRQKDVQAAAAADCIAYTTLKKAKWASGVRSQMVGQVGLRGCWYWCPPGWTRRQVCEAVARMKAEVTARKIVEAVRTGPAGAKAGV